MLQLNQLEKLTQKRKRVGRGGKRGRYCGRGKEGQKSRTGSTSEIKAFFEGGQMPLIRRIPRRGFVNPFKREFKLVNLQELETHFNAGDTVNLDVLLEKGLVKGRGNFSVKVLGNGKLTKKLLIQVNAVSKAVVNAVEAVGGSVQLI